MFGCRKHLPDAMLKLTVPAHSPVKRSTLLASSSTRG